MLRYILPLLLLCTFLCLQACGLKPWVKPYERQRLADPIMQFEPDPIQAGFMNHMRQSREAARGASGAEGGGCGCN